MRLVVHEGVPSYWSDTGSHLRNGLGFGVQLVCNPVLSLILILIREQDGYGPVTEYYQDGEYHSVPVSKVPYLLWS